MALKTGEKAPDFTLPATSGKDFTLSVDQKHKPCIIYFYPKDFTTGCTAEACSFRDTFDFFENQAVDVIGISRDDVETHRKFKEAHNLPFELLADTEGKVSDLYKASVPLISFTKRITYLLDGQHTVVAVYDNLFNFKKHINEMVKKLEKQVQ